jgi:hypothetical protein
MTPGGSFNRRAFLRGGGIALALPWLASLAPRSARGQSQLRRRFLPITFPNGSAEWWLPTGTGSGAAWQLSPILAPLAPLKERVLVLSNVENYTCFGESTSVEPSHGLLPGAQLTCVDSRVVRETLGVNEANGVSVDQVLAQALPQETLFASLQVGLSTWDSYCDGQPCSLGRSVSWRTETEPLYKVIDPVALWSTLTGIAVDQPYHPRQREIDASVLDAVLGSAQGIEHKLDSSDRRRFERFLQRVRDVEQRVKDYAAACSPPARPGLSVPGTGFGGNSDVYNRQQHAELINELIAFAFECDLTRVISYMLDDARSEFVYDHVEKRSFEAGGSTALYPPQTCSNFAGAQTAGEANDGFASINYWLTQTVASLCEKLAAIPEGEGSVLDNTVIYYGSYMHGGNHSPVDLPTVLIGGGPLLKPDQHLLYSEIPLRDVFFTLLNGCFELGLPSFGSSVRGLPNQLLEELLP